MSTVLDEAQLQQSREKYLEEMEREVKLFAKRAEGPVQRAALSEIEQEILNIRTRWKGMGMLNGSVQLELEPVGR